MTTETGLRACGTCTLCCKLFPVPELNKPAGKWCPHIAQGAGCGIHETRPLHCREFFCLWMTDPTMPDEWKPERSKIVLTTFPATRYIDTAAVLIAAVPALLAAAMIEAACARRPR